MWKKKKERKKGNLIKLKKFNKNKIKKVKFYSINPNLNSLKDENHLFILYYFGGTMQLHIS